MSVETPPPAGPATPEQPAGRRCPRCGAAMTDQQDWCLSCGAAVGTRIVAAPGWRVPIAIAGVILALAAIALAVAIVQLADDTDEVAQNPPPAAATPSPVTPSPTIAPEGALTPDPTLPEASGQGRESPEPAATPDRAQEGSGSADAEWPAGRSGWTVVLASDSSESDAREKADGFAADGISGVGVLDSDDFSSLEGGRWIVFAGEYDSQSDAADALDGIDAKDAYIRHIEPA